MAPILCYVTDRKALPEPAQLIEKVRQAIAAGIGWVQIREKDLPGRPLAALVREAVASAAPTSARIIVNDRLDVALACGAHGVHLGGDSLPVRDVVSWTAENLPRLRGPSPTEFLIGRSCHSLEEALAAERDGAAYVFFGPVFATPSKLRFGPPQGLDRLREVCRALRIPVLAIGGITLENLASCLQAGAAGCAAIRLFQQAEDLPALIKAMDSLSASSGAR